MGAGVGTRRPLADCYAWLEGVAGCLFALVLTATPLQAHSGVGEVAARIPGAAATQVPCPRQPARTFAEGSVTVIPDGATPCRIGFRDTGIRLEAVADGSRPDPGRTVVVDSDGRFLSANAPGWRTTISVWDARGRYLHSFGGEGEGPGEFLERYGRLNLMLDGQGRIHIRDGSPGWSVFSREHEFIRRVPAHVMGGLTGTTIILDGGSALASDGRLSNQSHHFRVTDSSGALERVFGPVGDGGVGRERRAITFVGGDTFWAGPGVREAEAYVMEEWTLDGELRRTIRRDVSWWEWRGDTSTSTSFVWLHLAGNGLLYVVASRPTEEYVREFERLRTRGEPMLADVLSLPESAEYVVEVIDTRSGQLLSSDVYTRLQWQESVAWTFFHGSTVGYRYTTGDDGLPVVEIMAVELVRR